MKIIATNGTSRESGGSKAQRNTKNCTTLFSSTYLIHYLSFLCTIGITKPIIIANVKDVFQSTIAPFFSINKFHNNVTIMAAINVITNANNTFNIIPFAFIVLKIKLLLF